MNPLLPDSFATDDDSSHSPLAAPGLERPIRL